LNTLFGPPPKPARREKGFKTASWGRKGGTSPRDPFSITYRTENDARRGQWKGGIGVLQKEKGLNGEEVGTRETPNSTSLGTRLKDVKPVVPPKKTERHLEKTETGLVNGRRNPLSSEGRGQGDGT